MDWRGGRRWEQGRREGGEVGGGEVEEGEERGGGGRHQLERVSTTNNLSKARHRRTSKLLKEKAFLLYYIKYLALIQRSQNISD